MNIDKIKNKIKKFADERNWDKFHTPKNLAMALSVEVSELIEIFQWLNQEQSQNINNKDKQAAKEEIADIAIYLIRIADKLNIDLEKAIIQKLKMNAEKYPVNLSKDNATKYNKR